ncbi:hypothetical protein ANCCAN_20402 [Ancylostoma caninum]|uniref:Follistatin-like domain-containing protein n=1 Tax=Ancylostoma caninum TaxID=29170 RepID=A0A368FQI2_ANCCA|nr:hypothetical protein ANCCAN_20402 [Ancylostoma caninum]
MFKNCTGSPKKLFLILRGSQILFPGNPCAVVLCAANTRCVVVGGQARCDPIVTDPPPQLGAICPKQCPYGQVCRLTKVECFVAPCPLLEECVPETSRDAPSEIRKPCTLACPVGQKCAMEQVLCKRTPCPAQQRCVPMTMADGYHNSPKAPTLTCANALCAPETPRCVESPTGPKCVAVKTCSQVNCKKGQRCDQPEKFKDAECVTDTTGSSTSSYVDEPVLPEPHGVCNLFCIRGRRCVVTPSGPRCVPTPTCNELRCPIGKVCKQDDPNLAASCVSNQSGPSTSYADEPILPVRHAACNLFCIRGRRCVVTPSGPKCLPIPTCNDLKCPVGKVCKQDDINKVSLLYHLSRRVYFLKIVIFVNI